MPGHTSYSPPPLPCRKNFDALCRNLLLAASTPSTSTYFGFCFDLLHSSPDCRFYNVERLRASQTQFNLLGRWLGQGRGAARRRQNVDHSPGFVPPPDFCPRGKSDKIRPWLGTKVCSALAETGIQTTNTFLHEPANITFVKIVTHKTF